MPSSLWAAHTVERYRVWHAIIALGRQTRLNNIERGMSSPPLDSTHGRSTSGVECHHRLWTAHTIVRRRGWHAIIAFGQHTRSNKIGRVMPSSPLRSTSGRTTSSVACHHHPWTSRTVRQRPAWHDITALGQHTRSIEVRRGMTSPPLDCTHGRTTSGVTCHHRLLAAHSVE